jgi:hypothetical protein
MQAYEFSSIVEDDGIIHIPAQYLKNISSPVKVNDDDETQKKTLKNFSAIRLETKGFKFDRDAANERS